LGEPKGGNDALVKNMAVKKRLHTAGGSTVDPSDPFATIQKLLKLVEVLQAERNAPEEEEVEELTKEVRMLRLENQNMYALKEENKKLKDENKLLKEKVEQFESQTEGVFEDQVGLTIGGSLDQSWRDAGGGVALLQEEEEAPARPRTAMETIEEVEAVDRELAELFAANERSLREIKKEMKQTKKMFEVEEALMEDSQEEEDGDDIIDDDNDHDNKENDAHTFPAPSSTASHLFEEEPPSMAELLIQRTVATPNSQKTNMYKSGQFREEEKGQLERNERNNIQEASYESEEPVVTFSDEEDDENLNKSNDYDDDADSMIEDDGSLVEDSDNSRKPDQSKSELLFAFTGEFNKNDFK